MYPISFFFFQIKSFVVEKDLVVCYPFKGENVEKDLIVIFMS